MVSVLVVHEYSGVFGGAERYLELLARGLAEAGHQVGLLAFCGDADPGGPPNQRLASAAADTWVHPGRAHPGPIRAAVRRLDPDLLHWNFVDPFAFRGASWLLLPWGRPSVITDHLPQLTHAGLHWETTRRLANRRIRAMIVVGEAARAAAASRWAHPPPIRVVPNGVPTPEAATRLAGCGRPLRLLFVGRLTAQKGATRLPALLDAVRAGGVDATLRVVGEGPLAGELAGLDLAGFSDDPLAEMAAADVLVAPSEYEGLPFTPLEALSTGLPVVLSDIPPHRELADEATGVGVQAVDVGDAGGWAEAVGRVASDLPAASADALARARAHSLEQMVEQTLAVYASVR